MKAPDKIEWWQAQDMTREQLVAELLLRDDIIQRDLLPEKNASPSALMEARQEGYEEGRGDGIEKGYEDAMQDVRRSLKAERTRGVEELAAEVRKGIDELHAAEAPGPIRRVVEHLYWLINFA
jgi:flagellar biosynthesis/type III secretory pathway protein FliH